MTGRALVTPDPWTALREQTDARIALGRAGGSLPTQRWLEFQAAHAAARDAVHEPFAALTLAAEIERLGVPVWHLASGAPDRQTFLVRPDLGRQLASESRAFLAEASRVAGPCDLTIVVTDGLSASAAHRYAVPLLEALLPRLDEAGWKLSPICVVPFGRVALHDEIGELLESQLALTLLGERPGLTAPDSLGAYLTYAPRRGRTDAERNCLSNIRGAGLSATAAADAAYYLLTSARDRGLSGVALKDDRPTIEPQALP